MGHAYRAVQWNRQKRNYDLVVVGGVLAYLAAFMAISSAVHADATAETLLIRALGTCAFVMLHVVLSIGPLARIDRRFLPLLYNRRHLGVTMAVVASLHGAFSIVQFHAFGDVNPIVSVFTSNARYDSFTQFPFQPLGLAALVVIVLMAATSHDFWLANLTAPVWKALHMLVYVAYGLLVMHVALGTLQTDGGPWLVAIVGAGALWLVTLHGLAAARSRRDDLEEARDDAEWVDACDASEIRDGRAKVVRVAGERVAIFRDGERLSALSGVCQHQNGPLGEGRVVDGLVVCPWHGYQYRPDCGLSPEPFHESVPTFRLRLVGTRVHIDPRPLPLGTETDPLIAP